MSDGQNSLLIARMERLIAGWQAAGDKRFVFLSCYLLITRHTTGAIAEGQFEDGPWVQRLLQIFADRYLAALELYDAEPARAPAVWRQAHDAAATSHVLQNLLLGINAHINYDLALALVEALDDEWRSLSRSQRASRRLDYDAINVIISNTIDTVQDDILAQEKRPLADVDRLFGPADEFKISIMVFHWRNDAWRSARRMLAHPQPAIRELQRQQLEQLALMRGRLILLGPGS